MLVDTEQQALERIRGNTSGQQFHIHRADFGISWDDLFTNFYQNGNLYVIDVNLEIYVRFEIVTGGYSAGSGFVNFLESTWIVGANTLASDDGPALVTILNTLQRKTYYCCHVLTANRDSICSLLSLKGAIHDHRRYDTHIYPARRGNYCWKYISSSMTLTNSHTPSRRSFLMGARFQNW